ncbi:hypothetical protein INT45_000087 [Circinella minor]|uniref:Arrestin C-terminal-like domain-containing protein n=1 Tax=Circinella minor TaxID=1195481 RepID=A0A8H7S991_9FUNG|nr:hypothetical protein INT45_000087 [Circinella minor]
MGFVVRTINSKNKETVQILIKINQQYHDGNSTTVRCTPGAVFEGEVEVYLTHPLDVEYLRLIFRGVEVVNYGVMGRSTKGDTGTLFGVRTTLSLSQTLDPGYHRFPFLCQMPMVNFPHTFKHGLLDTSYTFTATINDKYKTEQPFEIKFEPHIATSPYAKIHTYTYNRDEFHITLLTGLNYQQRRDHFIRIKVVQKSQQEKESSSLTTLITGTTTTISASLKRYLTFDGVSIRPETLSISSPSIPSDCASSSSSILSRPDIEQEDDGEILEIKIPYAAPLPSVTESSRFSAIYKVCVHVKVRCGPMIMLTRKLFEVPIHFGTMPHGTHIPDGLLSYTDDAVAKDMTTRAKPRLDLSSESRGDSLNADVLPVYTESRPPPYYPELSPIPSAFRHNRIDTYQI